MQPGTIFISHRAEYGHLVGELKKAIETTSNKKITVFISEELQGAENWRAKIKSELEKAESLFLVYGAPNEDWTWCFYEAGYFAHIDAYRERPGESIYCIARPKVPPPGPLNDLQMVTNSEKLIDGLIAVYDRNKVKYDVSDLRNDIGRAAKGLFSKLEDFFSYPHVCVTANDAAFGTGKDVPASAVLKGERALMTQLFGIGTDEVTWGEIANPDAMERTEQERFFFSKWVAETRKIILAARENRFVAPQTVLVTRGGPRYRFLLFQGRKQGDGSYFCEFLLINEVGGPALGLSQQQLALLTSIRLGFRFRFELFGRFPNKPSELSGQEIASRIKEIPQIMDGLTTESSARGNLTLEDLQGAFETSEADRIAELTTCWKSLKVDLYDALGLSNDGDPVSDQGLKGNNLKKYRLAFEAMRMINAEFLSRSCARISQTMKRSDEELRTNARQIESNMTGLDSMRGPATVAAPSIVADPPNGRRHPCEENLPTSSPNGRKLSHEADLPAASANGGTPTHQESSPVAFGAAIDPGMIELHD
jgi:hypothetical protein